MVTKLCVFFGQMLSIHRVAAGHHQKNLDRLRKMHSCILCVIMRNPDGQYVDEPY